MKIPLKIFKGIEYIQISLLPEDQRLKIRQMLGNRLCIKILIDGKIISDCLQYKDYEKWYDESFSQSERPEKSVGNKEVSQAVVQA